MFSKTRWSFAAAVAVGILWFDRRRGRGRSADADTCRAGACLCFSSQEAPAPRKTLYNLHGKMRGADPLDGAVARHSLQHSLPQPRPHLSRRGSFPDGPWSATKMVLELGAKGAAAKSYLDRCLAH